MLLDHEGLHNTIPPPIWFRCLHGPFWDKSGQGGNLGKKRTRLEKPTRVYRELWYTTTGGKQADRQLKKKLCCWLAMFTASGGSARMLSSQISRGQLFFWTTVVYFSPFSKKSKVYAKWDVFFLFCPSPSTILTFSYDSSLSVFPGESWAMARNLPPAGKWDRGREKHEACGM